MMSEDELQAIMDLRKIAAKHRCMVYVWRKHIGKSLVFARCSNEYIGNVICTTFNQFYDEVSKDMIYSEIDISECTSWEEIVVKVDLNSI